MIDDVPTTYRLEARLVEMLVAYQNKGKYIGVDGKKYTDSKGIIYAWEMLDKLSTLPAKKG